MRSRVLAGSLALAAMAALAAGCSASTPSTSSSASASGGASSATINLYQAPVSFNPLKPALGGEQLTESLVYDNLLTTGPGFKFIPRLAQSWTISADAKTFTFSLRPGLKWSDGKPFTASDVVFSLNAYANPKVGSAYTSRLSDVVGYQAFQSGKASSLAGVKAVSSTTVQVSLTTANAGFLSLIGYGSALYILPQHILGSVPPAQLLNDQFFTLPNVGLGPYVMTSFTPNEQVVLKKNPNYRAKVGISTLYLKMLTGDTAENELGTGELDLAQIAPGDLNTVKALPGVNVSTAPSTGFLRLLVNFTKYSNPKIRQGLLTAIDRAGIIQGIYRGNAQAMNSDFMVPSVLPAGLDSYAYNPTEAKQLLEEGGFDFSKPLTVAWVPGTPDRDATMTIVLQNLKAIGIDAVADQIDTATQLQQLGNKKWDLMLSGGGVYTVDPSQTSPILECDDAYPAGSNTGYFCDPNLDKLLNEAATTANAAQRTQLYQEAAKQDNEDVPDLWLDAPDTIWATSSNLKGFVPYGDFTNGFVNAANWTMSG
jgi:peptide/nickel transport system substrate-binding protein